MSDYDNKLSGALFKNDKGDNPKRPDYKGTYTDENGKEFWVSSWVKKDKNGNTYMSLSMQPKDAQSQAHTSMQPKDAQSQAHTPKQEYQSIEDYLPF